MMIAWHAQLRLLCAVAGVLGRSTLREQVLMVLDAGLEGAPGQEHKQARDKAPSATDTREMPRPCLRAGTTGECHLP